MTKRVGLLACIWVVGCSTTEPNNTASPFVISNPVPLTALRAAAGDGGVTSVEGPAVYVSLPTGTIPNGLAAAIGNRRSAQSVGAQLIDGGLDPTPIPGRAGDTLDIVVSLSNGGQEKFVTVVPIRARPIVIRTEPKPHKRDVPLNASIIIVFSEPIQASSLSGAAFQLLRGTVPVGGQLEFTDETQVAVALIPDELVATTDYVLTITPEVQDLTGDPLEATVTVPFSTADSPRVGELRVSVTTQGEAPDEDGYVVAVGGAAAQSVGVNGGASFALPEGVYTVYLSGLALNCEVIGESTVRVSVATGNVTSLSFAVACPRVAQGSLLVTVTTSFAGTGWPSTFPMHVDGGADQPISVNGYLVISPIAPGTHTVAVKTPTGGGSFCLGGGWPPPVDGWYQRTVQIGGEGWGRVDFTFQCIP